MVYLLGMKKGLVVIFLLAVECCWGQVTWEKIYDRGEYDYAPYAIQTKDGGYLVAGFNAVLIANNSDFCVIKTDSLGNAVWTKLYSYNGNYVMRIIQPTLDGNYIFSGDGAATSIYHSCIIKIDSMGDTLWTKKI